MDCARLGGEMRVFKMKKVMVLMVVMTGSVMAQFEEEEEQYRGQLIGSLNSYHHQVTNNPTTC